MRDSFIFYRSFYEAIKDLPPENKAKCYDAIFEFGFNHNLIELEGIDKAIFTLIKPQLEANYKRYENGKKQKTSKQEAKGKQKVSKSEANVNVNDNVNDNVNENVNLNANENGNENKNKNTTPLQVAIDDFKKMRKAIKKPLTQRGEELLIKELNKLSNNEQEQIAILEQSTVNCWQGVFELKEKGTGKKQSVGNQNNIEVMNRFLKRREDNVERNGIF